MGPNKIYELIVTIINALGVAFTDTDKQALFTVLPFVINTDNGYANNCSMNSIYKHMMQMLDITRPAAESRLRRALKRLQDNVDRMTYQNIFMRKENVGPEDIARMSQHDLLYCVVEYVVNKIQKEIGGPAKNDCDGEPDCAYECTGECSCVDEPSSGEDGRKAWCEPEVTECCDGCNCESVETPVVETENAMKGESKRGTIEHILSTFELPFICNTKDKVVGVLCQMIRDNGGILLFDYVMDTSTLGFWSKLMLMLDILSFEADFFHELDKEYMYTYFGKKSKMFYMKPSAFMDKLARLVVAKHKEMYEVK